MRNVELELTQLEEHPQAYDLGGCEFHLAFEADDYEVAYKPHKEMSKDIKKAGMKKQPLFEGSASSEGGYWFNYKKYR